LVKTGSFYDFKRAQKKFRFSVIVFSILIHTNICVSSYFPRLTLIFLEFLFKIGRLATYFVGTLNDYSIGQIDSDWTETLFSVLYDYKLY
jgi:hypothetical protein